MFRRYILLASASMLVSSVPALAQSEPVNPPVNEDDATAGTVGEEIIVQARRRDESQQDVPLVVQAVTAENLQKLNIREFEEVETLVPGLSLGVGFNGIGVQASLRGVNYDVNASGNNGTIEFYLNDAPLSAGILFQSLFDVGQIEVLRGPQGTLRGRASPSGSITVTTKRPDLTAPGGYGSATINDIGGWNGNGAINVPIIEDVLGIRIAGVVDENDGNRVRSINSSLDPFVKTASARASVRVEPAEWLSLFGSYTHSERKARQFSQVESARLLDPGAPASLTGISAEQGLGVGFIPQEFTQNFRVFNWLAQARFGGQKLDYVGSHNKQRYFSIAPGDTGAFFGSNFAPALRGAGLISNSAGIQETHELRLSNEERVFGMFDYVVGALYNKLESPTELESQTPLFIGVFVPQNVFVPSPANFAAVIRTPVIRGSEAVERSLFGNITAHIGEDTEISGGARYINYQSEAFLTIGGVPVAAANEDRETDAWIFSASAKHDISEDLMVYASFGSSFRPGSGTNPIILRDNVAPSPRLSSFYFPEDEKSKSYEIGFKSDLFNRRLRLNVTAYHQDFDNYAYSARGIYYSGFDSSGANRVFQALPAIAVGVPAKVDGIEAEIGFQPTDRWSLSANASYTKSKIKGGVVPCNVYGGQVPTVAQITAATGGEQIATCITNFSAGSLPPFSATVQSEYLQPFSPGMDGYVRGLLTFAGNSQNDPANAIDDVDSYALLNLFAGVRDPDGAWEIGVFVKNVLETERVLSRDANASSVSFQQLFRPPGIFPAPNNTALTFGQTGASGYRGITVTPPREVGLTAKVQFGSR